MSDRPLDTLSIYPTATIIPGSIASAPTRYAVRQVLDQEFKKEGLRREAEARQRRYTAGGGEINNNTHPLTSGTCSTSKTLSSSDAPKPPSGAKRDFFGRVVSEVRKDSEGVEEEVGMRKKRKSAGGKGGGCGLDGKGENTVWVSFHEGFSNAVRKPIGIEELLRGL